MNGSKKMEIDYIPLFKFKKHHFILTEIDILAHERGDDYFSIEIEQRISDITPLKLKNYNEPDYIGLSLYFYDDRIEFEFYITGISPYQITCESDEWALFFRHLFKQNTLKNELNRVRDKLPQFVSLEEMKLVNLELERVFSLLDNDDITIIPTVDEEKYLNSKRLENLFE
jgi:hypothetical protein